jgi:hypothetical protein
MSSLFTASDPDGDAITQYRFWDGTADPNSGHVVVNGVAQGKNAYIPITASQLAQTTFQAGTASDQMWVQANDGSQWGAWTIFNINPAADHPAVVTASAVTLAHGTTSVAMSSLFTASDPDGDAITQYRFWDGTADPNSGHVVVNGVAQGKDTYIPITASQLAQTTFQAGTVSDQMWVQANDGSQWGAWTIFNINPPADHPPVVVAGDISAISGQILPASGLFTASDLDGDAIAQYRFWDGTADPNSGHVVVNGVAQGKDTYIPIAANQLAQTTFQAGTVSDQMWVQANDGSQWGAWTIFNINPAAGGYHAPATVAGGATLELTSLYAGTVVFAGPTGVLQLDQASTFTGKIGGQLAIGDVIDLTDITAGASATIDYTGNNSPGTLTISDGTHTAHIALLGNYSLANFTASSDGHGGTFVVDPPISNPAFLPRAASVSIIPLETRADTPVATASAAVPAEQATVASVTAASIAPLSVSTASGSGVSVPVAVPASLENTSILGSSGSSGGSSLVTFVQASGGLGRPALETRDQALLPATELPQAAVAREVVSPDDLILAIRKGDIAFKIDPPAGASSARSPWLFDDERGTFEAPLPDQFTIFVDGDDDDGPAQTGNLSPGQAFSGEAVVVPDQSWFGAIRMAWMQPARSWWWR